jgi:hypothetical protein
LCHPKLKIVNKNRNNPRGMWASSQRGLRPPPEQRQKNRRAKKSPLETAACKFPKLRVSAPDFFAFMPIHPWNRALPD